MTRSGYVLPFRILAIPIRIDISFVLLIALLTWLIASRLSLYIEVFELPIDPNAWNQGLARWWIGFVAAMGLVASVLLHELAHAAVARNFGVKILEIRLWLLGGVAQFDAMPTKPGQEALIALAGPAASLALGGGFWLIERTFGSALGIGSVLLTYLALVNVVLAVFNLLPALPMDGGRVLRALLAMRFPYVRATQLAAGVSRVVAIAMGLFGLWSMNLLLVAIAVFVYLSGQAETQFVILRDTLASEPVTRLMTRELDTVPPDLRVSDLARTMIDRHHVFFPVRDSAGSIVGTVHIDALANAPQDALVCDVMNDELLTLPSTASAADAFEQLQQAPGRRLLVTSPTGQIVGLISSSDLLRALQVRMALNPNRKLPHPSG